MRNLKVNDGIREFSINNDESRILRVNTTDMQLFKRAEKARTELEAIAEELKKIDDENLSIDETIELLDKYDKEVRTKIDYIFNSKVSDTVFGEASCVSFCGGQPLFQNFLESLLAEIEKDFEAETKKAKKNVAKYTSQVRK